MTHVEGDISRAREGSVLCIGINRPGKLNGFTPRMMEELARAYTELEDDPTVRVGLLHGQGDHFTAGLDLSLMAPHLASGAPLFPPTLVDPLDLAPDAPRRRSKPVVAAVRGITYTIGIELMLAADMVVAAADCRFAQLEVRRGIMATGGATVRFVARAGLGNALRYLLTGDEFDVHEALRLGLVQRVVPAGREFLEAMALAQRIAQAAPLAVAATRANALLGLEGGPGAAFNALPGSRARLSQTDDAAEGVRSFQEKRAARFMGS